MHFLVMFWTDWIPINIDLICILYFLDNSEIWKKKVLKRFLKISHIWCLEWIFLTYLCYFLR